MHQPSLKYPYDIIFEFRNINQLKRWKSEWKNGRFRHRLMLGNRELESMIYGSLIHKAHDLKSFDTAWSLFEESKAENCASTHIYTAMFDAIYRQYIDRRNQFQGTKKTNCLDHRAVRLTRKLHHEMKGDFGFMPTPTGYAMMLKTYINANEFEIAESVWNEYLSHCEDIREEITRGDLYIEGTRDVGRHELENTMLWNHLLSLYRRQNKMDKVFEIYDTILQCNVMRIIPPIFIQVLLSVAQIIALQKEKDDDIPKSNRMCNEYVVCAERVFVDAHTLCRAEGVDSPEYRYMFVLNALMQCYANNGSFHGKCRNFWNLIRTKDNKHLWMALDESLHSLVDDQVLQSIVRSASMTEFMASLLINCVDLCCKGNAKFDVVCESEIYWVLDEVMAVVLEEKWCATLSEDYNRVFWNVLKLVDSMLQHGGYRCDKCFVYCFGFFNLFLRFGVTPSQPNLSYFFGFGMTFFKFEKRFKEHRKGDLEIIQHCDTALRFDRFMQRQCALYNVRKDALRIRLKSGHQVGDREL